MATTRTLLSLRTSVRQKANMENSTFVSDAEINTYLNQSLFELFDLLVAKYEDYFVASPLQITTDGINQSYNLPDGTLYAGAAKLYKLLGVDIALAAGSNAQNFVSVPKFNFAERNQFSSPSTIVTYGVSNTRYHVVGNKLTFIPLPQANQIVQLWYVPAFTTLANDTDNFDGISGWDEYVVIDAAMKCLAKEESDVSVLMSQKAMMLQRIESMAANRDAGQPATITDVTKGQGFYPDAWWGNGIGY